MPQSTTYKFPTVSSATPDGWFSVADVACLPSPLNDCVPVPAIVEMALVDLVIRRMRWLLKSPMYTLPVASKAMLNG